MIYFSIIAGVALLAKVRVLTNKKNKEWAGPQWYGLVTLLALLNLSELLIYLSIDFNFDSLFLLKSYFICCVVSSVFAYAYVAKNIDWQEVTLTLLIVFATIISVLALTSNLLVDGFYQDGSKIYATKGELYIVFQLYILGSVFFTLGTLWFNFKNSDCNKERIAYQYTFYAFGVLAISIVLIILLGLFGVEANGSGFIPVGTTIFLIVTAMGKNSRSIEKDIRVFNPLSDESQVAKVLSKIQAQSASDNIDLEGARVSFEYALITYKLKQNNGNKSKTARDLGISRASLYDKLGLKPKVNERK